MRYDETMNAIRGYVPDDDRNFSDAGIRKMKDACRDLCYLINHGYDLKSASTFTGNHYLLSERQRLAVVRSTASDKQLAERKEKEVMYLSDGEVWIDGFNEIITLEVMCCHSVLLKCMDGTIRDLASLRGSYHLIPQSDEAVLMMLDLLKKEQCGKVHILLDEPVSNSGRLMCRIAEINEQNDDLDLDIQIIRNVDQTLYEKENVITSDSVILDHCGSWFNLSERCLSSMKCSAYQVW